MGGEETEQGLESVLLLLKKLKRKSVTVMEREQVQQFLEKGIAPGDVKDALLHAYRSSEVEKPWNYFCGICRRIISRTNRGSVGESVDNFGKFPWS